MFKKKHIPFIEFLPLIIISLILYKVIDNFEGIASAITSFLPSLSTIIWGLAIAYLMNFPLSYIEKKIKVPRVLSLVIVYAILFGTIAALFTSLIPEIGRSIQELIDLIPPEEEIINIVKSLQESFVNIEFIREFDLNSNLTKIIGTFSSAISDSFTSIVSGVNVTVSTVMSITTSLMKLIFGLIISMYVLKDKERLTNYTNRTLKSLLPEKRYDSLLFNVREIHEVFSKYIVGKSLDSFIIAVLCFIGLSLMKIPFALLISFIVGITNMIPYFGPFIGMFPSALIALLASGQWEKGLGVLIFIIVLQQLDGWLIGPKILGDSVGLDPLVVIIAIIIGGAAFGILGMFVSVPIVAILRSNFERFLEGRINKTKKLSSEDIET
ncbi:AI-2E family transporter [Oceanirhabdus sp. W0125-5]|uniref:AI-2E family transporter n=1 Tax=Oceanirhabdus sp. W0125-5 TaxID=2999116 RepID=UPI0022F2A66C|nr:AI-2E family transporter [Oceanirhabdus sp. W0125-5]WBW98541.1 AI-2E family transporter [Oceanirhabdus sp. W0125-5]